MSERKRFADWAKREGYSLVTFDRPDRPDLDGQYFTSRTRNAWRGWQAAKLDAAETLQTQVERLQEALQEIADASPGLGYDYDALQDLAKEALAHPESEKESDEND